MARDDELNVRVAFTRTLDRGRQLHLDVAGGVENEGDQHDTLGTLGCVVEAVVE